MIPTRWSLARRLLLAAGVLVLVVLPLAGGGLAYTFRQTVTASFDERLDSMLRVLLASVEREPLSGRLTVAPALGDARFERVFSGWYWQVGDGQGTTRISRSLWDQRLPLSGSADGVTRRDITGPRGEPLRLIERRIRLANYPRPLRVGLAVSRQELDDEVARFEWLLWLSLLTLGVLLLGGLAAQIRWGLAPLRRLHADLREVEAGREERLGTRLPAELGELAGAMNEVLARDRRLIERGRAAAGNLAHALKTPISVLGTLAGRHPEPERIRAELTRLDEAVRHHLARASAAGGASLAGRVRVDEALAPVIDGLGRLAERRGIVLDAELEDALSLRVDAQDLQEMVGNLLENALNWAQGRVTLRVAGEAGEACLDIEDDGPGMSPEQREAALARGARLDERRSGSGLGLAIVEDLMALYGGRLTLEAAPLGGLAARIRLPLGGAA
ncbi:MULTISPECIES: sensor histidine kinase [Halomonas]|uniref:histidine kinase n=1 Tax=Halomonas halophila TaxID=29573 RepID=A0ABQ0U5S0_9GAMM|nr:MULTISPECIES: HAMP domain-containing sensor histidine kinase [Halomonas]MDR5888470.1 HAMP domain-containing sensor histidine kinase [Halomonas salina]WJY07654.1 HAMP domain-containing sensor histidine kinase [Halomonas halophila]GEK73063.1 ATPase [Halomonas halophila]